MRLLMLNIFFALGLVACSKTNSVSSTTTTTTTSTTTTTESGNDKKMPKYIALPSDKSVSAFQGKAISFEGVLSKNIHQHMMKGSLDRNEKHSYVDYNNGSQIVVYYTGFTIPKSDKPYKFYGTVDKMSGAGKGGGTHTEYYIMLDKFE